MNFFSDPALRARQDILNAQWNSLWGTYNATCSNGLNGAFPEFATDFNSWREFYDSGSDWSGASKHATDEWQRKAQEWAGRLKNYGCGSQDMGNDLGIPGVKDPPPDEPGLLDKLGSAGKDIATIWGVSVSVIFIVVAVVVLGGLYFISKTKVSAGV